MQDVALRSGVSESTVSHVINGTKAVSASTRERVERAMRELSYHRDSQARRLARGHSDVLGLVISDIENPFFPGLIKAFEAAALSAGYEMLLRTTGYDPLRAANALRTVIENRSPGVAIMTSRISGDAAAILAEHGTAAVFLDSQQAGELTSVLRIDYAKGAREAVLCLYHLGHREFAMIAGPQQRPSHRIYREAVEAALGERGLAIRVIEGSNDVAGGEAAIGSLLGAPRMPSAILCSNDLTAVGAIRALTRSGVQVPAEVSVVGADDIPFAELTRPSLTTVRIPRERLGELAVHHLIGLIGPNRQPGREELIDTSLVIRETTAMAPNRSTTGVR